MNPESLLLVRETPLANLVMDFSTRKMYLHWTIPQEKTPISFLFCWKTRQFCKKGLHRVHLTCCTCKVLKWVNGKLPVLTPITIHQIWKLEGNSETKKLLFRYALSLTESLS